MIASGRALCQNVTYSNGVAPRRTTVGAKASVIRASTGQPRSSLTLKTSKFTGSNLSLKSVAAVKISKKPAMTTVSGMHPQSLATEAFVDTYNMQEKV